MCNRYRPASIVRIRDVFGFTYIESGPERETRYNFAGIGPWQLGPFVRAGGRIEVGQWGLTPDRSPTLRPQTSTGRPISTNNARWDPAKRQPEKWSFRGPWLYGQRCIVPAEDFDEPYWGTGKNIWWRFRRADGDPSALAGLWNEWQDPATGEILTSYTMLTINCDAHPVLRLMHKPERGPDGQVLPDERQDTRTVVPLERDAWDQWLHGTPVQAAELIKLPPRDLYIHGAADPAQQVLLQCG